MLRAVGHPVAVNPDGTLARVAREEGWQVLRFDRLGPQAEDGGRSGRGGGRRRGRRGGGRGAGPPSSRAPVEAGRRPAALDAPRRATTATPAPGLTVDSEHGQAPALPPRRRPARSGRRASRRLRRVRPRRLAKSAKIGDNYFRPHKITINKGTTVTWNWKGFLQHNVHVKKGPSKFHSRSQVAGTFSHVFTKRGTYHLYCTLHPFMTETIVVR